MIVPYHVIEELGISKNLACNFSIAFARFEYALKAMGYVQEGEAYAKPNWELWAKDPNRRFAFTGLLQQPQSDQAQKARSAYDYISIAPPKKQKWNSTKKELYWDDTCPLQGRSELENMVDALKRMRNNFFHGGKFLTSDSTNEPRDLRNKRLLIHGLALLDAMLTLDTDLSFAFYH